MSVKKVGDRWHIEFAIRGQRVHRVMPASSTRQQAQARETQLRRELIDVRLLDKKPAYTLGEAIVRYLEGFKGRKSEYQTTHHATAWKKWAERLLSDAPECALEFLEQNSTLSTDTLRNRVNIVKRTAKLAYKKWGWLDHPIYDKIEVPPPGKSAGRQYSRDEVAGILRHIRLHRQNGREIAKFVLASLYSGYRKSELLGLKRENFCDGPAAYLILTDQKNGAYSHTPVIGKARWLFRRLPFKVKPFAATHAVHEATDGSGRLHDFRHTAASWMLQSGIPIEIVSKILRHSSVGITSRIYSHVVVGQMHSAMEQGLRKKG